MKMIKYLTINIFVVLCVLNIEVSQAAVIFTETFVSGVSGWGGLDTGMTVSWNASEYLQGTFAAQGTPTLQEDAFRADSGASGGAFTGDYWTDLGNFYGWTLSLNAFDVLPSQVYMQFSDGINTYRGNLTTVSQTGSWLTLSSPGLVFGAGGWVGAGGLSGVSNALANVSWVEVTVERSGTGMEETYGIDNFRHSDGGPGPESSIPEPGLMMLFACGITVLLFCRESVPNA